MDSLIYFYQYLIFFYSFAIALIYVVLSVLGFVSASKKRNLYTEYEDALLNDFPEEAPGISVVTPAYNEENIVIDSTRSLLGLNYPNFEVIVVNDGSTDKTLELLKSTFDLEEIPFPYIERVRSQSVRGVFKSTDSRYEHLTVIDKENGGTKADAMNAGINVAKYDYFVNTDIDGLLAPDILAKMIIAIMDSDKQVIAVGATMRMVNGCNVKDGEITRVRPPRRFFPSFQEIEYLRSYLIAKMGWSTVNAIANVSGGFGLFDKHVVINAGGYDPLSQAEDMDMTLRMIAYMRDNNKKYRIRQIPDTGCWTEGPPNLRLFARQRTRWGRGFAQIFAVHHRFLFNPRYGRMGLLVMGYAFIFDLITPLLTLIGMVFLGYLLFNNQVNFETFGLMLSFVYFIGVSTSLVAITADLTNKKLYKTYWEYGRLMLFSLIEAVVYQPFNMIFTVTGYFQFIIKREFKWTDMTRQGYSQNADRSKMINSTE